ncbi:LysR substrate-binding domain-containing protein, partial [Acinetobacter baumannii]
AYPDITVRLSLSDATIDLVESRVDLAVRIGEMSDSGLVARRLGAVRWIACASPGYLARRGVPATPEDLDRHDCVGFER